MSSTNVILREARKNKNDEFYTQLSDIEKEIPYYKKYLEGKIVYCNCDDWRKSMFYVYFKTHFDELKLKKLICTGYQSGRFGVAAIYDGVKENTFSLSDDGDFRSEECLKYLEECDVVITNPMYSLFREYIKTLFKYNKKFLIIGSMNVISFREVFPKIRNNEMWEGISFNGTRAHFEVPKWFEGKYVYTDDDGKRMAMVNNSLWFTNIPHEKRNKPIPMTKTYCGHESEYKKYDNYDAIEVGKLKDIPKDYDGVMGVPITFIYQYCPTQFKILGLCASMKYDSEIVGIPFAGEGNAKPKINGNIAYARIFIQKIK